ncbi:MAG: flagellin [Bdellovibrionia bacterium]
MSLRINTNIASLHAQSQLRLTSRDLERDLSQLASGTRFSYPGADAATSAISQQLKAQQKGIEAAAQNADIAHSFIQTAEGSLNEQNNILIRLRELAVQGASDTYSDKEREFLNLEAAQLKDEFDRIALSASFGSTKLLSGENKSYEFQVGHTGNSESRIQFTNEANTRASELSVDSIEVSDKSSARDSLNTIDEALTSIAGVRAQFGSVQSRLEHAGDFLLNQRSAIAEAKSRLSDTDVAQVVSNVKRNQVLQQYQAQVLNEANQAPIAALKLVA